MYWPSSVPQIFAYHGGHITDDVLDNSKNGDKIERSRGSQQRSPSQIDEDGRTIPSKGIIDVRTTRQDTLFATIGRSSLQIWSNRPTVVLASLDRSSTSLTTYGDNVAVFFRPDSSIVVIRTTLSYLITYSLEADPTARVLQQQLDYSQSRKQSVLRTFGTNDTAGLGEIILRFRRAIKIDAGINAVSVNEQELVISTVKPAAVQCIRWEPQKGGSQAAAQLLNKMDWMDSKTSVHFMAYDRAMNLAVWLAEDGTGYAVQRVRPQLNQREDDNIRSANASPAPSVRLFDGYCFHTPKSHKDYAVLATINARFSLIALATVEGNILCYAAKDYAGNLPLSHSFPIPASPTSTGKLTSLTWSPDGYCLFAGYDHGWATWSVFGKQGASSFHSNHEHATANNEQWLLNVRTTNWTCGGAEILITCQNDDRIWKIELSRSAAVGCFSCANLVRALLQSPNEVSVYIGQDMPDLSSISNEASLWHHAQYPAVYLYNQWPIRSCVVSQDGRYIAVAGRRGIAHYSRFSGRWKTFSDFTIENSFAVRGGMCWFNHILAVATENASGYDLRLYSREYDLGKAPLHTEVFTMPIAFMGPSGEESFLVYTYENVLYHFVIDITETGAHLTQVGQIAFHGVVRAPSRVRSVSWVLPDSQLRNGDPARDVEYASVLFLVDDKLVLLQPSRTAEDAIKYDMRVIAQHVEYYILMRDQMYFNINEPITESVPPTPSPGSIYQHRGQSHYSLRDSLWIFVGDDLRMWTDVRDVIRNTQDDDFAPTLLSMPVDFYPLSILMNKAVILGIESELLQRRDANFAQLRTLIRSQLILPYVLRYQLCEAGNTSVAFGLANQYQHLSYFPHALEMLLHNVLDDEADIKPTTQGRESGFLDPLPAVLSFMQMVLLPNVYLSTVLQCIRKTEVTFWRYLFAHLPAPLALFEQAIDLKDLKTASGWLIVLHGQELDGENENVDQQAIDQKQLEQQVVRLMALAKAKSDYELCSELSRFVMGIDPRGGALRRIIATVGFDDNQSSSNMSDEDNSDLSLQAPLTNTIKRQPSRGYVLQANPVKDEREAGSADAQSSAKYDRNDIGDYFSPSPQPR